VSDITGSTPEPISTPVTEPLQLADQSPVPPSVERPTSGSHTRTILEVVGGVVAVAFIVAAAGLGFALGHVTADHGRGDHRDRGFSMGAPSTDGQRSHIQPGQGQQGFGQQGLGQPGFGQGQGGLPGQGVDPRGIDPDGDNWTGGGMMGGPGQQGQSVPTTPAQ
jgi:hypothetical protein